MIPQNQNNGRSLGRSNSGRQADPTQRNYNRSAQYIPIISDILGGGGGGTSTQTTTQQNLPDWAVPDAMSTLSMGNYYTQNPDYRPSALDRDYSGIRGYNQMGQPNSQAGQFGLNPMGYTRPLLADPSSNSMTQRQFNQSANLDNMMAQLPPDLQTPLNLGRGRGRSAAQEDGGNWFSDAWDSITDFFSPSPTQTYSAPTTGPMATPGGDVNNTMPGGSSSSGDYPSTSYPAINTNSDGQWVSGPGNTNPDGTPVKGGPKTDKPNDVSTTYVTPEGETTDPTIDPKDIFSADDLTPFQAFDRQRFAAPGQNTVRGEGILAGRYNQRFGPGGTDPFAAANAAVGRAADYQSGFQGTTGGIGGQAGNYQTNLANAKNPGVFQSGDYTSNLPNYANPNAGMQSTQFGNANAGLTGAKNYDKNFQNLVNQSMNPYQDQVVNQTISDLDRARRMTQNEIGGQAAKAGAFGGSRQALLEAENNRNYLDRVAAATGQLRQQGFESAANRASQENLQRLGLTAQDLQQTRGLASQGNLAAQGLTAQDAQNVRGLQSQGNLAALNANAGLFQNALGLNAAADRSAMGYNAGLLSDAMGLDAADLNQRRNLASTEAQFAENALRNAGALNLSGGQALGQLAQAGTADERQRIADMLAAGGAGDARNQQDLDFIYGEFNRELAYPGQQIDLRNAAISPATGSIVTTTQPRYEQNPILGGAGAALAAYGMTKNPWIAGGAGLLSLLS